MQQHAFQLLSRHQQIDQALRLERRRPWPDVLRLHRLKALKRTLKDRLSKLMAG